MKLDFVEVASPDFAALDRLEFGVGFAVPAGAKRCDARGSLRVSWYSTRHVSGELQFGLAKRPQARRLRAAVEAFLLRVDVLPWSRATAVHYGALRAELTRTGKPLAPLDMLIAAQALEVDAVLVTNDAAFSQVRGLRLADWTRSVP